MRENRDVMAFNSSLLLVLYTYDKGVEDKK
jgi:hypothetical protein